MAISHVEMSPLQMVSLVYTGIHVQPFVHRDDNGEALLPTVEFNDVDITCRIGCWPLPDSDQESPAYIVEVSIGLLEEQVVAHRLPYVVDVEARGQFRVIGEIDPARRETVVEVNGASLVVGALRQLVAELTASSSQGAFTLPTLRFVPRSD